jgi:hypothetical protein
MIAQESLERGCWETVRAVHLSGKLRVVRLLSADLRSLHCLALHYFEFIN